MSANRQFEILDAYHAMTLRGPRRLRDAASHGNRWSRVVRAAGWLLAVSLLAGIGQPGAAVEPDESAPGAVSAKVWRHAQRWIAQHDPDVKGHLSKAQWQSLDANLDAADANQDGIVTVDELARHIANFGAQRRIRLMPADGVVPLPSLLPPSAVALTRQTALQTDSDEELEKDAPLGGDDAEEPDALARPRDRKYYVPSSRLPPGLPDWFLKADHDGDGQLTFAEYAALGSPSAEKEFARYDRNRDGLITPNEVLGISQFQRPSKTAPSPKSQRARKATTEAPSETSQPTPEQVTPSEASP